MRLARGLMVVATLAFAGAARGPQRVMQLTGAGGGDVEVGAEDFAFEEGEEFGFEFGRINHGG